MSVLENPISPRLQISADGSEHPFSRFFGQFRCASQLKFLFNSGLMRLDCLHTQVQLARQTRRARSCKAIHDSSIDQDVLFFVFPNSAFGEELTADNLEAKVNEHATALFNRLRGAT